MALSLATLSLGTLGRIGNNLGPRARKAVRYIGLGLLALVTFVFAFQATFPFDRVKDKVVETLAEKYDVTIGELERSIIPGRMYFRAFTLRTRPAKSGDVATTFYVERLEVDLGLLALLRGAVSVHLDAKIGPGRITGKIAISSGGTVVKLKGEDLPSASLPMREVLGLPMSGKLQFSADLDLPNDRNKAGKVAPNWPKAEGSFELSCPANCVVGDGKSKLKLSTTNARQQAFLDEGGGGIDFGKVNIDSLLAQAEIKNGHLSITRFDLKSGDGDARIAFDMTLNQDIQSSQVTGCLRFRGSDALMRREPKTHAALSTTGGPLGPDNLFHIKLDGQLRQVRRLGVVCSSGSGGADSPGGTPPRPTLNAAPEMVARPPAVTPPAPPPVAPPPAAPPTALPPATVPPPTGSAAPETGGDNHPQFVAPPTEPPMPPAGTPPAGGSGAIQPPPGGQALPPPSPNTPAMQ